MLIAHGPFFNEELTVILRCLPYHAPRPFFNEELTVLLRCLPYHALRTFLKTGSVASATIYSCSIFFDFSIYHPSTPPLRVWGTVKKPLLGLLKPWTTQDGRYQG
jgi:hypothetical protein